MALVTLKQLTAAMNKVLLSLKTKAAADHKHGTSDITNFPSALKNPSALTLKIGGATKTTYDGGSAQSFDVTLSGLGAAPTTHSHPYAGANSSGGSALSAAKLDTTAVGSTTQPVYFKDGKPVALAYSLNVTVPSNAKFTDTKTTCSYDAATEKITISTA